MKRTIQGAIAMAIAFLIASPSYAILYNLNRTVGAGSVFGTVTTNGATGGLLETDITDFNLTFDDGTNAAVNLSLSGGTGAVHFNPNGAGNPLSATLTDLIFDFSGSGYAHFDGVGPLFDDAGDFYCFVASSGHCGVAGGIGETIRASGPGSSANVQFAFPTGQVSIAKVPEPGTLAILGLGLIGLGVARRRKAA